MVTATYAALPGRSTVLGAGTTRVTGNDKMPLPDEKVKNTYQEVKRQATLHRSATMAGSSGSLPHSFHQGRGGGSTSGWKFQIASALRIRCSTNSPGLTSGSRRSAAGLPRLQSEGGPRHLRRWPVAGTFQRAPIGVQPVATANGALHLDNVVQHHASYQQGRQRMPAKTVF